MNIFFRLLCVSLSVLFIGTAFALRADAQSLNFGGVKVQAGGNQSNSDDEEQGSSNQQGNRRSRSNRQSNQSNQSDEENSNPQFQQFFPGQSGQGQPGSSRSRNSNKQNQFQGNPQFQNQQFQNQQFQGNQNGKQSFNIGQWNGNKWQGTRDAQKWTQAFGGNQQPFSSQWYKDHPKAWKYDGGNSNRSNIWIGGSLPGAYAFLGWGNVPQQYRVYYGNNVQQFDRSHYGEWYPLGVFSLMAGPGDPGTRMVQLAVDQHGHIAGNYYDMITNSNYSLSGDIRQQSQRVSFALNKNQFVRFRVPLYQLLQPYGMLTVQLPGGDQQWQFVRLEN
jgi:hypothetical protein